MNAQLSIVMRVLRVLIFTHFLLCGALSAQAADVSLLQGGMQRNGAYLLALQVKLPPGWMTYWRNPGEAGLAPKIDSAGSKNIREIKISYPAPKLFLENGLKVLGDD